jgi:alkanesulfonate monooxygenase SsuD/methylene tetrahydromethanopterin reductase-like flavin-dependent oxidoreductase (luciferase family)
MRRAVSTQSGQRSERVTVEEVFELGWDGNRSRFGYSHRESLPPGVRRGRPVQRRPSLWILFAVSEGVPSPAGGGSGRESGRDLELGLVLPTWTTGALRWQPLLEIAREAEAAGFDALWVTDHLLLPSTNAELRARAGSSVHPDAVAEPEGYLECFTVLTAVAAAIPRLKLGSLVACTGYRNPFLLAKIAETLDEVCDGRLILGVGAGDSAGEHETIGLPTDSPVGRFEETLRILKMLFSGDSTDYHGAFHTMSGATLIPRGPRPKGPPILIGTLNPRPRMRRIVAQYADIWNGWLGYTDASAEAARVQLEQIARGCREHGRDLSTLSLTTAVRVNIPGSGYVPAPNERPLSGSPQEMADVLRGHAALGIEQVQVALTMGGPEGVRAFAPVIRELRR